MEWLETFRPSRFSIANKEVAKFSFAAGAENLDLSEGRGNAYTLAGQNAVGVAGRAGDGQLFVYVLRPSECCVSVGGDKFGRSTMGHFLDFLGLTTVSADVGTEAGHEFGHALYLMQIGPNAAIDRQSFNDSALKLENAVRKSRDPNAPVRTVH